MSRALICAGNWKMNKNPAEAMAFADELSKACTADEAKSLVLFPPALCISSLTGSLATKSIRLGGQNCHWQPSGAYTGENSAEVLKSMGVTHCLVGHSERRQYFSETNEMMARKVKLLQSLDLMPVLCIGETLEERESGETKQVLERQLHVGLSESVDGKGLWLAYEPVWAIGTGKVATPEQVAEIHLFIRAWLKQNKPEFAASPILYGGSVKPENAKGLASIQDVDGFLVGGASLEVSSFLGILRASVG